MKNTAVIILVLLLLTQGLYSQERNEKSTGAALGLAIGVTALSTGIGFVTVDQPGFSAPLLISGSCIAPSLGHIYAGNWGRAGLFIGLRGATLVGAILLVNAATSNASGIGENIDAGIGTAMFGCAVGIALISWDWALTPSSVQEYNNRLNIKPEIDLKNKAYGVGFTYHF